MVADKFTRELIGDLLFYVVDCVSSRDLNDVIKMPNVVGFESRLLYTVYDLASCRVIDTLENSNRENISGCSALITKWH